MQFTLHNMKFDNVLAYGTDNSIDFDKERVTQIVGLNGVGKSTLPVVLEELLYNKNSRGIKKAAVRNRQASWHQMSATFSLGNDLFELTKIAKASAKVRLTKNGEDISGHTATQTYKTLEKEIGLDFTTFSKLVYQSMKSSLDFLSATDTNRKKFLVGLLGLEKYAEVEEQLKKVSKQYSTRLSELEGSLSTTRTWLARNSQVGDIEQLVEVPEEDPDLQESLAMLRMKAQGVEKENTRIRNSKRAVSSAKLKAQQAQEKLAALPEPPAPTESVSGEIQKLTRDLATINANMATEKSTYQRFKTDAEKTNCPTCGSELDVTTKVAARDKAKDSWLQLQPQRDKLKEQLDLLQEQESKHKSYVDFQTKLSAAEAATQTAEEYLTQVLQDNPDYEVDECSVEDLQAQILRISTEVQDLRKTIDKALEQNKSAEIANAKRETLLTQLKERREELIEVETEYNEVNELVSDYKVLVKAFGAKGLVAYKIESSIKSLEEVLNNYLSRLTAGRFALGFELEGVKLDVKVYDDSEPVDVSSLSSGEFANVQVATLLAIRKILSSLSSVNINVLFLDEIISVIDGLGRDRLIDLLLEEDELNTFVVSHEYSHPLASKLHIIKEDGLSKIKKEV